jgi:hypothetical protein
MNGVGWVGLALTVLGLAGYVTGLAVQYPGRSFSVTAVMIGITLAAIARQSREESPEAPE